MSLQFIKNNSFGPLIIPEGSIQYQLDQINKSEEIYHHYKTNPELTKKELLSWIKQKYKRTPSQRQLNKIIKHKFQSSLSLVHSQRLEKALLQWITTQQQKGSFISEKELKQKAEAFQQVLDIPKNEMITFSNGWIYSFKKRNNLCNYDSN